MPDQVSTERNGFFKSQVTRLNSGHSQGGIKQVKGVES